MRDVRICVCSASVRVRSFIPAKLNFAATIIESRALASETHKANVEGRAHFLRLIESYGVTRGQTDRRISRHILRRKCYAINQLHRLRSIKWTRIL